MKGYVSVIDKRTQYLKDLLIENGFEIVDNQNNLDFYFIIPYSLRYFSVISPASLHKSGHGRFL